MNGSTQVGIGIGLGYLLSRIVIPRKERLVENRSRRKKKFVRVRGHMRCMPKSCKTTEPKTIERIVEKVVEKVAEKTAGPTWSKPPKASVPSLEVPSVVELAENDFGEDESTVPSIPSALVSAVTRQYDWPTMADVTKPSLHDGDEVETKPIRWDVVFAAGSFAAGVALLGTYLWYQQARNAPEETP